MTQNCLQIVDWLKSWFTPKDEDYQYNITASNYNPNIESSITITVTVTDGNDDLVDNHSFTLNANGTNVSLTTSNGVATYTYTCNDWGICRFSVKSFSTELNVQGLRGSTSSNYDISYDNQWVEFKLHSSGTVTATTSWKDYGTVFGTNTRPSVNVQFMEQFGAVILRVNSNGVLQYRSITGSNVTANGLVAYAVWHR